MHLTSLSGCVTSAETVLLQEQSFMVLVKVLEENTHSVCVSISSQSISSFAARIGKSYLSTFLRISELLKRKGVHYVLDTTTGNDIALFEAAEEFVSRYRSSQGSPSYGAPVSYSTAISSTKQRVYSTQTLPGGADVGEEVALGPVSRQQLSQALPVLASQCPGLVCYAEKTQPHLVPHISSVKSAQEIMGVVLKHREIATKLRQHCGLPPPPSPVYHVAVQPCYDKKLEGARKVRQ